MTADGQKSSFTVVNEDGWKIDLTNGAGTSTTDSSTATDSTTG